MSAYAALLPLRRVLVSLLDSGGLRIGHTEVQVRTLHDQVNFLLDFLENSRTCKPSQICELERRMREAAYDAEDRFELHISGILGFNNTRLRNSMKITLRLFLQPLLIPAWTCALMLGVYLHVVAAVFVSMIVAVVMYLLILLYDFPVPDDSQEETMVFRDFNMIVRDALRIKVTRGRLDRSAYAALISLRQILDSDLVDSGRMRTMFNRTQLESLLGKVNFLLRNASTYRISPKLDAKIRDAVDKAITIILLEIPVQFSQDSERRSFYAVLQMLLILFSFVPYMFVMWSNPQHTLILPALSYNFIALCPSYVVFVREMMEIPKNSGAQENQELRLVIDDLSMIVRDAVTIEYPSEIPSDLPAAATAASASSRQDLGGKGKNVVVGLTSDLRQIKARLVQDSSTLEVISIVGMGGVGKTTLAREVYADPHIVFHFDIHAWVTVSQDYSLRHVMLSLLDSAKILTKQVQEDNAERLGEHLHKNLKSRRYLIVMDDAWDTKIWDFVKRFLPDDYYGSRVLLTSRLSNVASYPDSSSPLHQMQCLNENDSWHLLRDKVFAGECCPQELETIGRTIALNCRGLPLAIVVISGILCHEQRLELEWRSISKNLSSILSKGDEQCSTILGLSYEHLPHRLKPCFMYMGAFPEDEEIPVTKLFNLWAAEGFLEPSKCKSLEEVAEEYLKDLIQRSLIMVGKWSCNGKIKTCKIHDLLRDVCLLNARKENFLHVVDGGGYVTLERDDETPRRLSIRPDALQANARHDLISSYSWVRSFLYTSKLLNDPSVVYLGFLYLRVLDVLAVHFGEFPDQIIKLVRLRYLAFHYDGSLPPSMSKLHSLETIVHHHCSFNKYPLLPRVIWSMPNLRHLYVKPGCYLSDPLGYRLHWKSSILEHLQTLVGIRNFKWSKGIIKRIPNLKKLVILYDVSSSVDWSTYQLESLVDLHQLETLKIIIKNDDLGFAISHDPPKLAFPLKLKKLTLSGCGIPWASIGALPNLEALKLRCEACSGSSWETVEGDFPQLIYLLLEQIRLTWWETDASHFPRLQRLVIRSCGLLEEIPSALGDIPTLEMIELVDCLPSAVDSANQIQEEQESMGNVDLKVCIGL